MDRIMGELFGDTEQRTAETPAASETDQEREARREARQRRKADAEARRSRKEFIERYTTGNPSEGFTTEEAIAHLREMREEMSPAEFRRAMQRTLEHLPPDQRDDFLRIMREYQSGAQPATGAAATAATPAGGAAGSDATTRSTATGAPTRADPFGGLLTGLMGGSAAGAGGVGVGDLLDDLTKGGLRAPTTTPGKQPTEADFHSLLNSPLGRAVLGGVAAFGLRDIEQEETRETR